MRILLLLCIGMFPSLWAGALSSLAPKFNQTPPADFEIEDTLRERLEELEDLSRYFYLDPSAKRAVKILDLTYLSGRMEPENSLLLFAFHEMFRACPDAIPKALEKLDELDVPAKTFLLILLKSLDHTDFEQLLDLHENTLKPGFRQVLRDPQSIPPPAIPEMELNSPHVLDLFWAYYFMTGETAILDKVIQVIEGGDLKEDSLASASYWALGSVALRDTKVLKYLVRHARTFQEATQNIKSLAVNVLIQKERDSKTQPGEEKAWFLNLLSKADTDSQLKLALCYFRGVGVEKDEEKGQEILLRYVGKSQGEAEVLLAAVAHQNQDSFAGKTTTQWLEASFEEGSQKGLPILIQRKLYSEKGIAREEGWGLMSEALSEENTDVLLLAASEYRQGVTTEQNYPEAIRIYEKLKADQHPSAAYELAQIYGHSDEKRRDFNKAKTFLEEACSLIVPHACLLLKHREAEDGPWFEGYRMKAEQGDLEAVYRLGFRLYIGESVEKDPLEGRRLLDQAIEEGHAMAANNLAYTMALDGGDLEECSRLARFSWENIQKNGDEKDKVAVLDTLAWIAYLKKEYQKAWDWMQKIPEEERKQGEVQEHFEAIQEAIGAKNLLPDLK